MRNCTSILGVVTGTILVLILAVSLSEVNGQEVIVREKTPIGVKNLPLTAEMLRGKLQGDEYNVLDYSIDIFLTPDSSFVTGSVVFDIIAGTAGVSTFEFNLDQPLFVDSISAPFTVSEFDHIDDVVNVFLDGTIASGDTAAITVYYHGVPPPPIEYGTLFFRSHSGHPVIYSISWPDNARAWWPCKDDIRDKATATIIVTIPEDLVLASNGVLTGSINNGDGTKTVTWREMYPVTTYNICVAITNYDIFLQQFIYSPTDTMPVSSFVYPEDRDAAEEDWNQVDEMIAVYDSIFGGYPFLLEKYGMAETPTFPFAAMEHQTITSYGDLYITGDHRWDMIVAHELAHSWYGNSVTPAVWEEIWLSEGFCTYAEALWAEYLGGIGDYHVYMGTLDSGGFPGTVYDPVDLLGETVYNKGAWVVHMLRYVVGDSAFFEILPAFANDPAFKYDHASTQELITLSETISGMELNWFFDQWVYQEGRPNYLTTWESSDTSGTWESRVSVDQVQSSGPTFKMPLELLFVSGTDSLFENVYDSTTHFESTFSLPWEPENVVVDPRGWVLKSRTKPLEITTTELVDGYVGTQYYAVLRSEGGVGARLWSIEDGALPDGLELTAENGLISGVPTVADSFSFLVRITDSWEPPHIDELRLSIVIHEGSGIDSPGETLLPKTFALDQNFPNPFNPRTLINFSVPGEMRDEQPRVLLEIYDLRGRKVKTLVDELLSPGIHQVSWDGSNRQGIIASSGIYLYVLKSGNTVLSRKMLLTR